MMSIDTPTYTKYVGKEEKDRFLIVYPKNLINNNKLVKNVEQIENNKYKIHMKRLPMTLEKYLNNTNKWNFSEKSFNMLKQQLNRLHKQNQPHSNIGAETLNAAPVIGGALNPQNQNKYRPITRQVLVEMKGNQVNKMFLTNFEFITNVQQGTNAQRTKKTSKTYLNRESTLLGNLINFLTPSKIGVNLNSTYNSPPVTKRRITHKIESPAKRRQLF